MISEPHDYICNGLGNRLDAASASTLAAGMFLALLSVVYSALRAGSNTALLGFGETSGSESGEAMESLMEAQEGELTSAGTDGEAGPQRSPGGGEMLGPLSTLCFWLLCKLKKNLQVDTFSALKYQLDIGSAAGICRIGTSSLVTSIKLQVFYKSWAFPAMTACSQESVLSDPLTTSSLVALETISGTSDKSYIRRAFLTTALPHCRVRSRRCHGRVPAYHLQLQLFPPHLCAGQLLHRHADDRLGHRSRGTGSHRRRLGIRLGQNCDSVAYSRYLLLDADCPICLAR